MLTKEQLISELQSALSAKTISKNEIKNILNSYTMVGEEGKQKHIAKILYYVGGLVIFLGLGFFIAQEWETMGSLLRIGVTLGFGLGFSVAATFLTSQKISLGVSDALNLISGLLIPTGIFVTLYEFGYREGGWGTTLIFLSLAILWWVLYYFQTRLILLIFSFVYGTIAYLYSIGNLVKDFPLAGEYDLYLYALLALGATYGAFGHILSKRREIPLSGPLYFFSAPIILGASMTLQGYSPDASIGWELLYPLILFGGLYLSVYLQTRSFLVFSSLFIIGYVIKIMNEYFRDALSGPILLILAGMLIMGMGYFTFMLNTRYFKKEGV